MQPPIQLSPDDAELLDQVIADCMEQEDRGRAIDPEQVKARYPQLASALDAYFRDAAFLQSAISHAVPCSPPPAGAELSGISLPGAGQLVAGRYRLIRRLGRGGMGTVHLAFDEELQRHVALKFGNFFAEESQEWLQRFRLEAQALAQLHHPHICQVYHSGEADGRPYIVMQYVDGLPLSKYISAARLQPIRESLLLVRKLALALAELHAKKILHRDLKPLNVMVNRHAEPVIVDFGLARREEDPRLSRAGEAIGTPHYMSAEQIEGRIGDVGPRTDLHALGVILYQLLTGRLPYQGRGNRELLAEIAAARPIPPSRHCNDIDPQIDALCLRMMAGAPETRFASAAEAAAALTACLASMADAADSPATPLGWTPGDARRSICVRGKSFTPLEDESDPAADEPFAAPAQSFASTQIPRDSTPNQLPAVAATIPQHSRWDAARRMRGPLLALAAVAGLLLAGIVIIVRARGEQVEIHLSDALSPQKYQLQVDGRDVAIDEPGERTTLRLSHGTHHWRIAWQGEGQALEEDQGSFHVERGTSGRVTITISVPAARGANGTRAIAGDETAPPVFTEQPLLPGGLSGVLGLAIDASTTRIAIATGSTIALYSAASLEPVQTLHEGPADSVTVFAANAGGTRFAAGVGTEVHVWEFRGTNDARPIAVLETDVSTRGGQLAFSDDGRWLAVSWSTRSASRPEYYVRIDDLQPDVAGAQIFEARLAELPTALAISPDRTLLAVGTHGGRLLRWRLPEGARLEPDITAGGVVHDARFDPDSELLAAASRRQNIAVWNARSAAKVRSYPLTNPHRLAFSPDGRLLAATTEDRHVWTWNVADAMPLAAPLLYHGSASDLRFSPDGVFLAAAHERGVTTWRVAPPAVEEDERLMPLAILYHPGSLITTVAVSPDERFVAAAGQPRESGAAATVCLWSLPARQLVHELTTGLPAVHRLRFSADGRELAAMGGPRRSSFQFWETTSGRPRYGEPAREHVIHLPGADDRQDFAYLPGSTGALVLVGNRAFETFRPQTQELAPWDVKAPPGLPNVMELLSDSELAVGFALDRAARAAAVDSHAPLAVWDAVAQALSQQWWTDRLQVDSIASSADGRWVLTGSLGVFELWDREASPPRRVQLWELDETGRHFGALGGTLSHDGRRAALSSPGVPYSALHVLDTPSGSALWSAQAHAGEVRQSAFLDNGRLLLTAGLDQTVRLWQVPSRSRDEPEALAWVLAQGGRVRGETRDGAVVDYAPDRAQEQAFSARTVTMNGVSQIANDELARLSALVTVVELQFRGTPVTDEGFRRIGPLPRLKMLDLSDTLIGDDALRDMTRFPNLMQLSLQGTRVTSAGISRLVPLQDLQMLLLDGTAVDDTGLPYLAALRNLDQLSLAGTQVTDAVADTLPALRRLRRLDVRDTAVTAAGVQRLQAQLPHTEIVAVAE